MKKITEAVTDLIEDIYSLDDKVTAAEFVGAINEFVDWVILDDDKESEELEKFKELLALEYCRLKGGHRWTFDHCGYWGHQYCVNCGNAKYPELVGLRCDDAAKVTNRCTEENYKPN